MIRSCRRGRRSRKSPFENTSDDPSTLTRTVSFTVNDGDTDSNTLTRDIDLTAENDAPVESTMEGTNLAYTENDGPVAITSTLAIGDADDTNIESAVVQITGNYQSGEDVFAFTDQLGITGSWNAGTGTLSLSGSALVANYETAIRSITYENTSENPSTLTRTVSFTVNDGDTDSGTLTRDIDLTAENDAPVESTIEGTNLAYTENDSPVAITATLAISDLDDTNIESAVIQITGNYASGEDILAFTDQLGITGSWNAGTGTLSLSGSATLANYETAIRSITYENTSDDPSTLTRTVSFTVNDGDTDSGTLTRDIDITAENDAPDESSVEVGNLAYTENDGPVAVTSTLAIGDVDDTNIESAVIQITGNYESGEDVLAFTDQLGITGSWNAGTGTLSLSGSATFTNYETALRSITYENTSDDPSTLTRTVSFTVNDGDTDSNTLTRDIDITAENDAPVESTMEGTNLIYTENDGPVAITSTLAIGDPDETNIESAVVQITGNYASSEDVLAFTDQLGITGSWNAGTGTLSLSGSALLANYETAIRSITYENTSDDPSTLTRTISFTVNDGDTDSNTLTRDIDVTAENDNPVESTIEGANLAYTENDGAVAITSTLAIGDPDDTNIESAVVQITDNYQSGEDVLDFTDQLGITGSWNAGTGTLSLSGSATLANYETAIRSITYENTSNDPSTLTRTVSFTVNDGDTDSNTLTRDIDLTAENDAPVESTMEGTNLAYTEGDGPLAITSTLALSDADDTHIESAVVQITGNYASGEDVLAFTNQLGITGSWDVGTGTISLSGSTTLANYETAIRSITYENTSDDPSTLTRTVSFTVNDGDTDSNTLTRDIDVTAAAAPPVTSTIEGTNLAYTENDGAVAITSTLAVSDPDDTNIESAVVQITGNYTSGEDVLAFTDQLGITGSWNAGTGTLSLSGSALLANYETALRSITYENTSDDPSTLTRTVSFTINDGDNDSNTLTRDIDLTAENDAPVESTIEGANLAYEENDGAVAITSTLAIGDTDDTNIESAVVQITGNYQSGEDVLAFTDQLGITGSWNAGTGTLSLSGSATLANYETAIRSITYENTCEKPSTLTRTISFTVNDGDTDSNTLTRNIDLTSENDAPVESTIEGANLSYTENDGPVAITSTLAISDVDDTHIEAATIQITANYQSGEDVLAFTDQLGIVGSWNAGTGTMTLSGLATLANYETALRSITYENTSNDPSTLTRTVSFTANDGDSNSNTLTRDIELTAENDAPVESSIEGANLAYTEGDGPVAITSTLALGDADDTHIESAVVQITGNYASSEDVLDFTDQLGITGSWDVGTGTISLSGSATLANYETAIRSITYENTSGTPATLTRTVSFTVNDGDTDSNTLTRDIDVAAGTQPPVTSTIEGTNLAYTENDGTAAITSTLAISDVDDTHIESAVVQITGNYASGEDVLAFTDQLGITGSWNAGTGTLSLSGSATLANYETALRSITYENTSDNPSTLTTTVSFTVNYGDTDSNTLTRDIDLTAENDAPIESTIEGANIAYTENDGPVAITSTLALSDVDDTNIESAVVQITGNYQSGEDVLDFTNQLGITGSWNAGTGTLSLSGSATLANYETAIRSITYENTSDDPSTLTRTISFTVNDGDTDSSTLTRDIDVSAENDNPVESTIEGANLAYTENDGPVAITSTLALSDPDDTNIESAVVQITGNYASGEDILDFTDQLGITGSWNAGTGTLSLSGSATLANYETAIRSITYENTSENPSTLTRTVSFTVNDGDTDSNTLTRDIDLTAENDAPVESTIEGANLAYTENDGAVAITSTLAIGDPDDTNIESAMVQITGNYASGEDVLDFSDQLGITGSWNAGTGTLSLSGSATLANYETAIRSITYENTSDNPSTLTRTVSFTVNDGDTDSNTLTRDIDVGGALNDAPVNLTPGVSVAAEETPTTLAGISVSDADAGIYSITTRLQVNAGVLDVTLSGSASIISGASGSQDLTLQGILADVNATLASLLYTGDTDVTGVGADTLTITTDDGGNTGVGGPLQDVDTVQIDIAAVNDSPVNTTPGTQVINERVSTAITNITVSDVDVGAAPITTRLQVTHGVLEITLAGSATISAGANNSGDLTLQGSTADVNASLASLRYTCTGDVSGTAADILLVSTHDGGSFGAGGVLQDVDGIQIDINPILPDDSEAEEERAPEPESESESESASPDQQALAPEEPVTAKSEQTRVLRAHSEEYQTPAPRGISDMHALLRQEPLGIEFDDLRGQTVLLQQSAESGCAKTICDLANEDLWSTELDSDFEVQLEVEQLEALLDAFKQEQLEHDPLEAIIVGVSASLLAGGSTGYVLWTVKGSKLVAVMTSAAPWGMGFDPTSHLAQSKEQKGGRHAPTRKNRYGI